MTYEEYEQIAAINRSSLSALAQGASPAHLKYRRDHPKEPTPALLFGLALHALVLEPGEFEGRFSFEPEIDRRTKAGKLAWATWLDRHRTKTPLSGKWRADLYGMADAIQRHGSAQNLVEGPSVYAREKTILWTEQMRLGDESVKVKCKARLDALLNDGTVVDIKTCESAAPEAFSRAISRFRYHDQAWWYTRGAWRQGHPDDDMPPFYIIAVEKAPPYAVGVYEVGAASIEKAALELEPHLKTLAQCYHTNHWPGYGESIQQIDLPDWQIRDQVRDDLWEY